MRAAKHTRAAMDLVSSFVASFHPRSLRPMLRANYARELTSWAFMPVMLTGINAGAMGVILKKTFSGVPGTTEAGLALAVGTIGAATAVMMNVRVRCRARCRREVHTPRSPRQV